MAVAAAGVAAWAAANAGTIALVSTAASLAATGYSMYSQQQNANAQTKAQEEQNKQVAINAAASYDDLSPAEIDANKQANDLALAQDAEAIQNQGRVNLFAAASGTGGGSVDSMLFDIDAIKGKNINSILANREAGIYSIRQQAEGIRQQAKGNQSRTPIERPNWIAGGLQMASQAVSGYDKYTSANKATRGLQTAGKGSV